MRNVRIIVVALVIMWIALVAAWSVERALRHTTFAKQSQSVEEARQRLASVEDLSGVFAQVNTAVEPSVVKLDVVRAAGRLGVPGRQIPIANSGSGVIVEVDQKLDVGYLMTNNHVVTNASGISVTLADGRTVPGQVIGTDVDSDLAVVAIRAENLIAAEWGNSDTLRKGDWVLAFGSPFNFVGSMTAGIVSALNRTQNDGIDTPIGPDAYQDFIQVDAAINPGNSGGPLANLRGQIIGINTAIFSKTGEFSGIGFAIPSNQAQRVYDDIRQHGRFIRGWLGTSVIPVRELPELARRLGYTGHNGVFVDAIYRDTPAAQSGLRRYDIIISVNDRPVRDEQGLKNITAFTEPGQEVELEVFRDGETIALPARIAAMPDDTMLLGDAVQQQFDPAALGLRLAESGQDAVRVEAVAPESPADRAGIQPGDFILRIGNQPVRTVAQANLLLSQLDPRLGIEMLVASGNRAFNVVIRQ
jgi:serine protease Do